MTTTQPRTIFNEYCRIWVRIIVLGTIILVGIPFIVIYKLPDSKNPSFTIEQASISGFNLTTDNSHLTSLFGLHIRVKNPNPRKKFYYHKLKVMIWKDGQKLATDELPDFEQRHGNVTILRAEPVALDVNLKKRPAKDFGVESGMGYLNFDVEVTGYISMWTSLNVNCKHVVANVSGSSNSNFKSFEARSCKVSLDSCRHSITHQFKPCNY